MISDMSLCHPVPVAVNSHSWWKQEGLMEGLPYLILIIHLLWNWKAASPYSHPVLPNNMCSPEPWIDFYKVTGVLIHNVSLYHLITKLCVSNLLERKTMIYKYRISLDNIKMISHEAQMAPILNSVSIKGAGWLNFRVLSEWGEGWELHWHWWLLYRVAGPKATFLQPVVRACKREDSGLKIEMACD